MNTWIRIALHALWLASWLLLGCAHEREPVPSLRVVDAAVSAEGRSRGPGERGTSWRLYRSGDGWIMRQTEDQPVVVTARAAELLAAEERRDAKVTKSLPQEWPEELARLRRLVEENRRAMEQMDATSQELGAAARELLRRTEALAEGRMRAPAPTPLPTPPAKGL